MQSRVPSPPLAPGLLRAGTRIRVDVVSASIAQAMRASGIGYILLKGPSFSRWLYDEGFERTYADTDILVNPNALLEAEAVIGSLGFCKGPGPSFGEKDWTSWAWQRRRDGAVVDLHRSLEGLGVSPLEAWHVVCSNIHSIEIAGTTVDVLDEVARAVHLSLHAAYHGAAEQPLEDLRRGLDRLSMQIWIEAASLARRLEALPAFASGLRQLPRGCLLVEKLALPVETTSELVLRARSAPGAAIFVNRLVQLPGWRAKCRYVLGKLFPSADYIRDWSGRKLNGRVALSVAYIWRSLVLTLQAPRGLVAWASARKETNRRSRAGDL
jgi:hypothetical protein